MAIHVACSCVLSHSFQGHGSLHAGRPEWPSPRAWSACKKTWPEGLVAYFGRLSADPPPPATVQPGDWIEVARVAPPIDGGWSEGFGWGWGLHNRLRAHACEKALKADAQAKCSSGPRAPDLSLTRHPTPLVGYGCWYFVLSGTAVQMRAGHSVLSFADTPAAQGALGKENWCARSNGSDVYVRNNYRANMLGKMPEYLSCSAQCTRPQQLPPTGACGHAELRRANDSAPCRCSPRLPLLNCGGGPHVACMAGNWVPVEVEAAELAAERPPEGQAQWTVASAAAPPVRVEDAVSVGAVVEPPAQGSHASRRLVKAGEPLADGSQVQPHAAQPRAQPHAQSHEQPRGRMRDGSPTPEHAASGQRNASHVGGVVVGGGGGGRGGSGPLGWLLEKVRAVLPAPPSHPRLEVLTEGGSASLSAAHQPGAGRHLLRLRLEPHVGRHSVWCLVVTARDAERNVDVARWSQWPRAAESEAVFDVPLPRASSGAGRRKVLVTARACRVCLNCTGGGDGAAAAKWISSYLLPLGRLMPQQPVPGSKRGHMQVDEAYGVFGPRGTCTAPLQARHRHVAAA